MKDNNLLKDAVEKRGFDCQGLFGRVTLKEFRRKLDEIINKIENDVRRSGMFMMAISCHGTDNDELLFSDDTSRKTSRSVHDHHINFVCDIKSII